MDTMAYVPFNLCLYKLGSTVKILNNKNNNNYNSNNNNNLLICYSAF